MNNPTAKNTTERMIDQIVTTRNLETTMYVRETGNASMSFIVCSENSLPKTQLATKPTPISPMLAMPCISKEK